MAIRVEPAGQDDRTGTAPRADVAQELQSIHTRHVEIAQQDVESDFAAIDQVERSGAVRRLHDLGGAAMSQHLDADQPLEFMIFDNECAELGASQKYLPSHLLRAALAIFADKLPRLTRACEGMVLDFGVTRLNLSQYRCE